MGTYYSMSNTKQEEVADILRDCNTNNNKVLKHSLRGNCLWILLDCKGFNMILLYLMQAPPRGESGWGYRPMDESVHPYYYSCPLSYLDAAPVQNQKWRDHVIAWHAKKNRKFKVGEKYKVPLNWKVGTMSIGEIDIVKVKPLIGYHKSIAGSIRIRGRMRDSLELIAS